jgi:predicted nucleic acid-binding protein
MRLIVDTSIAIPWVARNQANALTEAAADAVTTTGAVVPAHFQLELVNALTQLERRGRLSRAVIDGFLAEMPRLPFEIDRVAMDNVASSILPLARAHDLTLYDAAYLELSLRTNLPLATRDSELRAAALAAGANLFSG